jgi:hypothetical protein
MRDSLNGADSQMLYKRLSPACYSDGLSSQLWACNDLRAHDDYIWPSRRVVNKYISPLANQALFPSHPF